MKSVKNKKSVMFCAFSLNVNNIFCDVNNGGFCGILYGNGVSKHDDGPREKLIDSIINSKLKIKDSNNGSIIDDNLNSLKEELLKCFKDNEVTEGVLTEFKYGEKFYYFFSPDYLKVEDFFKNPTIEDGNVFRDISKKFNMINVVLKGDNQIVKNDKPYNPDLRIQNHLKKSQNQNPIGGQYNQNPYGTQSGASLGASRGKEFKMHQGKEHNIANDINNQSNAFVSNDAPSGNCKNTISYEDINDQNFCQYTNYPINQKENYNDENDDNKKNFSQEDSNNYYGECGGYNNSSSKNNEKNNDDIFTNNCKEKGGMNNEKNASNEVGGDFTATCED